MHVMGVISYHYYLLHKSYHGTMALTSTIHHPLILFLYTLDYSSPVLLSYEPPFLWFCSQKY